VPAGRGPDDLVMSAALVGALEGVDLRERIARGAWRGHAACVLGPETLPVDTQLVSGLKTQGSGRIEGGFHARERRNRRARCSGRGAGCSAAGSAGSVSG